MISSYICDAAGTTTTANTTTSSSSSSSSCSSEPYGVRITSHPTHSRLATGDAVEVHALQYFCEIAAQYMSTDTNSFFWTRLVPQFCEFEPAARHSVIAISLLYQGIQENPNPVGRSEGGKGITPSSLGTIRHYNAAIRELKALDARRQQPVVLLVCVLFICIEFMQLNRHVAMRHFKHGALILQNCKSTYAWIGDYILPVFRHLSSFPFYFATQDDDIPDLDALLLPPKEVFHSVDDAWDGMNEIFSRCLRLTRHSDKFRNADAEQRLNLSKTWMYEESEAIERLLDDWHRLFVSLRSRLEASLRAAGKGKKHHDRQRLVMSGHSLEVRYEACRIILDNAVDFDEMNYDKHIPAFARMADLFDKLATFLRSQPTAGDRSRPPKFVFDVAFTPISAFVLFKCRQIDIRLSIWRNLPDLMPSRECLWSRDDILLVSKQLIEYEHGTVFDDKGNLLQPVSWTLPPAEYRVKYYWSGEKTTYIMEDGVELQREAMAFSYRGKPGEVLFTYE